MKKVTTKKKVVRKAPAKALPGYAASIKVLGRLYSAVGTSVREALENLKPEGVTRGMGLLTVSNGEKSRGIILSSPQTFRLFSRSRLMREVALKNTSSRFDL